MYKRYINSIIIIIIIIIIIHASYSLPKWQAVKLTFFVPWVSNKIILRVLSCDQI